MDYRILNLRNFSDDGNKVTFDLGYGPMTAIGCSLSGNRWNPVIMPRVPIGEEDGEVFYEDMVQITVPEKHHIKTMVDAELKRKTKEEDEPPF